MRPRFFGFASLALITLLSASSAFAARPAPEAVPFEPGPMQSITPGPIQPFGPCLMGVSSGAAFAINYLLPPDDAYYTLLDPANCSCPNGLIAIQMAHVVLQFPVACQQQVLVSVVPAIIDANGCASPDPNTNLCVPLVYTLAPPSAGVFQFNLPMPANCCISTKVFLEINFITPGTGCATSTTRPRLITNNGCQPCTSWNVYPGGFDDLCVDAGFPGNPLMWVDGDCCSTTKAEQSTWGYLKNLYR
jgi:hypothetical protein